MPKTITAFTDFMIPSLRSVFTCSD